jgi:nitronate monooxygenase
MRGLEDAVPDFPILNALTGPLRKASGQAGNTDFMSLWAGQSASLSRNLPAEELLDQLVKETEQTLRQLISGEPRG